MSNKSRKQRKVPSTTAVDTLLLAKYGIFQPVRRDDALVINDRLEDLSVEDKRELHEFACFLMDPARAEDFEEEGDEGLRDEP